MIDAAILEQCADQSLRPAIVERFIQAAGTIDPLAITVSVGNRAILVPTPRAVDDAMATAQGYLGEAAVRVGITQYPAGLGISDASEIDPRLFESCANVEMGTELFARVYRIVTDWYGSEPEEAFEDALNAWRSGWFEGRSVFHEPDPGVYAPAVTVAQESAKDEAGDAQHEDFQPARETADRDPNHAGNRIDLSAISDASSE
jgi:hypothetical protein